MASLEARHGVLTPEHVEFEFPLAGLYARFLAWMIDGLVGLAFAAGALQVVTLLLPGTGFSAAVFYVLWFLVDWGYGATLETVWSGQTLGKRAMGLRVLQTSGVRIGFLQALTRNLARAVDRLPLLYLLGGAVALLSPSRQRLGDLVAGTVVVRDRRNRIPASLLTEGPEGGALPNAAARERISRMGHQERDLYLSASLRREELDLRARVAVFAALARRLEEQHQLERPEHLSEEKFVLQVAAQLAQQARRAALRR